MNEKEKMQAAKQMSTQERDQKMSSADRVSNSINEPMNQTLQQQEEPNTEYDYYYNYTQCIENRFLWGLVMESITLKE
jgi:hypothetical protein